MKSNAITSCQTKKAYRTQGEALDTVKYLWEEKQVDLGIYKCPICENWHLTSKRK